MDVAVDSEDDDVIRKRSRRIHLSDDDSDDFDASSILENHTAARKKLSSTKRKVVMENVDTISNATADSGPQVIKKRDGAKNVSDEEWNKYVARMMEFSLMKTKQMAARAFQEDLIGKLPGVLERESLLQAGQLLDASARIYSFRVDATHTAAYEVRSKLGDDSQLNKTVATNQDISEDGEKDESENAGEGTTSQDRHNSTSKSYDDSADENEKTNKKKKCDFYSDEDLPATISGYAEDFAEGELNAGKFLHNHERRKEVIFQKCQLRRAKMNCIIHEVNELNNESSSSCSDHLYGKATRNFDEGSCAGLLMQNALVGDFGRKLFVHGQPGSFKACVEGGVLHEEMISAYDCLESGSKRVGSANSTSTSSFLEREQASSFKDDQIESCKLGYMKEGLLSTWRMQFQKQHKVATKNFLCFVVRKLGSLKKENRNTILNLLVRALKNSRVSPTLTASGSDQLGSRSTMNDDFLSMFETSFDWSVFRQSWDCALNRTFYQLMSPSKKGNADYNYFFARNSSGTSRHGNGLGAAISSLRNFSLVVRDFQEEPVESCLQQLRHILEAFSFDKKKSLFQKNKQEDLNRTLAALCITVASQPEAKEQEFASDAASLETIPECDETSYLLGDSAPTVTPVNGTMLSPIPEFSSTDLLENENAEGGPSVLDTSVNVENNADRPDVVEQSDSAAGDVHFDVNQSVLGDATTSLITDDSHWIGGHEKKNKLPGAGDEHQKAPVEKKRRKKVEKESEAQLFSFDDIDDFPLDVLRQKLLNKRNVPARAEAVFCSNYDVPTDLLCTAEMVDTFGFMQSAGDLNAEGRVLSRFFLDGLCKERGSDLDNVGDRTSFFGKSSQFFTLFNGCFEDELTSDVENEPPEVRAQDDDDDLFADELEAFHAEGADQIEALFPDKAEREGAQEFFVKCTARQRRINAQAVKRAISTVLSNKALDATMLKKEIDIAHRIGLLGESNNSVDTTALNESISSIFLQRESLLNLSAAETQLQLQEEEEMVEDPTRDVHNVDVSVEKVHIQGQHTFSSLLAHVPDFLTGRTAEDINPVDIFAIFLHLCNENNFEIVQRHDDRGTVLQSDLNDFAIINSRCDGKSRKRLNSHRANV